MLRVMSGFLLLSFLFLSVSWAKIDIAALEKQYGKDLKNVPFFLRFEYSKKFNKDWDSSYYLDRKDFLMDYQSGVASQQAKDAADARAEARQERDLLTQKREAVREKLMKLRAEQQEARNEARAERERQKKLEEAKKEQQKELDDMKRLATLGT